MYVGLVPLIFFFFFFSPPRALTPTHPSSPTLLTLTHHATLLPRSGICCLNLASIAFVLLAGLPRAQPANLTPFLPFGTRGMFSAASVVFFAFIGVLCCKNYMRDIFSVFWGIILTTFLIPFPYRL